VETNRTLLISVLGHPDFRAGPVTTEWLERAIR
jgi:biotin carboxylase